MENYSTTNTGEVALSFNDTAFSPIAQNGQVWITSKELAQALGYKSTKSVNNLYAANADEFNDSMTTVIDTVTVRKTGDISMSTRIFSLRGCHLVAMFARTTVAKQFRKWVLDVLDKDAAYQSLQRRLEALQQDLLYIDNNLTTAGRFLNTGGKRTKPELQRQIASTLKDMQPALPFDS